MRLSRLASGKWLYPSLLSVVPLICSSFAGCDDQAPLSFKTCETVKPTAERQGPSGWSVVASGFDRFNVTDTMGNSADAFDPKSGRVPLTNPFFVGEEAAQVLLSTQENFGISLRATGNSASIEIKRHNQKSPEVYRYWDLAVEPKDRISFFLCSSGPSDLFNGKAKIAPTAAAVGPAALDDQAPDVQLTSDGPNVTISATDPSGILAVRYSLDGIYFEMYKGVFQVPCGRDVVVTAFADDGIGNRSQFHTFPVRC